MLVVGGGIAAYCAAIAAREAGAEVRLLDRAPSVLRGGNARHSRNLRLPHCEPTGLFPERYPSGELFDDLRRASRGLGDATLARVLAERATELPAWLSAQGVHFERPADGNLPWSRKTAFLLGGGKAMINALAARAARLGIGIEQNTLVTEVSDGATRYRLALTRGAAIAEAQAQAVILCCGGYQANPEWLAERWGTAARQFIVRGMPYADGALLKQLLAQGAAAAGAPGACHLVAVDARSPPTDGGIVTRVDGMPWGIVVDGTGRRFQDEGTEITPRRYSFWGRRIADCPGQRAYLILDTSGRRRTTPSIYPPIEADTPAALGKSLGLDPQVLQSTIDDYNRALIEDGPDQGHTEGLAPPKSRCALPLRGPPLAAYPMAPGITFTSHGLRVDAKARVLRGDRTPWPGLYAAGTIMAPAILDTSYLAGIGLTISAVFGRLAGTSAARHVHAKR